MSRHEREVSARAKCPRHGDGSGQPCYLCRVYAREADARRKPWPSQDELECLRSIGLTDFWSFFLYGFGAGLNPRGQRWIDEAVHHPLALWYQKHVQDWLAARGSGVGRQKRLAVLIHREVGKTTMITEAGQLWLHLLDPETSSYTGSESLKLAVKILGAIKGAVDGSDPYAMFSALYGSWSGSARTWAGTSVTHAARRNTSRTDPSFGTFAVETSITGSHPDAIFYDDPISYERLESDTEWLMSVNSQVESLIPVLQSDGLLVWSGTRYDDRDHFGVAFENDGVASVEGMPTDSIEVRADGLWHVYFLSGRDKQLRPSTPRVWSDVRMKQFEKTNPRRYAAQILNDPSLSRDNPITREQLEQAWIDPAKVPWSSLRFAICTDVAFSDGAHESGKDETCFYVHGYPRDGSGDVFVIEGQGSPLWRVEHFCARLISTVQRYRNLGRRVFAITGEKARSGLKEVLRDNLRNRFADAGVPMPQYIEFERGGTRKYDRLHAAVTFWLDGHVRVVRDAQGGRELLDQLAKVGQYLVNPRIKIDRADAHSDAFQRPLYQPMRPLDLKRGGYASGATPLKVDGLDPANWDDEEEADWVAANPRPPLRNQ